MSRPAVSQHVKVLQDAGLVHTQVRGRYRWHELSPAPLAAIQRWAADLSTRHAALQEKR
jgi:DNA-binding transcriptional ArsR family regulator